MIKILLIALFIFLIPQLFYDGKPTIYFWLALILSAFVLDRISKSKADRKFYKERSESSTSILNYLNQHLRESQTEVKQKKEEAKLRAAAIKRNKEEAEAMRKKEEAEAKRKKEEAEAKPDEAKIKIEKIADFEDLYFNQASDEWMELVKYSIDESDAPIIMELDSTTTSDDLIFTKKRKDQKGYRSKILKQLSLKSEARSTYINETQLEVEPMCIKHNKFPWLIASLDGVSSDFESIVEFDCSASSYWKAKNNKISDINYAKLQHLMMVSGSDVIDYWSYWSGQKGILQKVERNDTYIESLFKSQLEFADNLI